MYIKSLCSRWCTSVRRVPERGEAQVSGLFEGTARSSPFRRLRREVKGRLEICGCGTCRYQSYVVVLSVTVQCNESDTLQMTAFLLFTYNKDPPPGDLAQTKHHPHTFATAAPLTGPHPYRPPRAPPAPTKTQRRTPVYAGRARRSRSGLQVSVSPEHGFDRTPRTTQCV